MPIAEVFGVPLSLLLLLAGGGLLVAEAAAPGAHFMVVGIALLAAGLVGVLLGGILPATVLPFLLAVVVLVAGGAALYGYRQFDLYGGESRGRTTDSASLRGKTGRVTESITDAAGEVKLEDGGFNPYYRARSMNGDIDEGEEVMVIDPGGGNVITVEPLSGLEDEIDRELARDRERARRESEGSDDPVDDDERDPDTEPESA